MLARCTSPTGSRVPAIASRRATLAWVYAAGLKTTASAQPAALCKASISSPSPLCCANRTSQPRRLASSRTTPSISASEVVPYTAVSRVPRRLRLGPFRKRTRATDHPRTKTNKNSIAPCMPSDAPVAPPPAAPTTSQVTEPFQTSAQGVAHLSAQADRSRLDPQEQALGREGED